MGSPDPNIPQRRVAVHEAGHVVAHIAVMPSYHEFDYVLIRTLAEVKAGPHIDRRGRASDVLGVVDGPMIFQANGLSAAGQTVRDIDASPEVITAWRDAMPREFIKALAGPWAEARHRHSSVLATAWSGSAGDFDTCRKCVDFFAENEAERSAMWRDLEKRTARIVSFGWASIHAVADALIERRRLTYRQVLRIMRRTGGPIAES